jgi:DNA-directed RNA polymerase subunit RPC12/RpoP
LILLQPPVLSLKISSSSHAANSLIGFFLVCGMIQLKSNSQTILENPSEVPCRICGSKITIKRLTFMDKLVALLLGRSGHAIREVCNECGKEKLTIENP